MNEKIKTILKIVVGICVLMLIVDVGYVTYQKIVNKEDSNYFDSINAFEKDKSSFIAVGSNNDNDKQYEKAKITKYNKDYEKVWEKYYNHGYNSIFHHVIVTEDGYVAVGSYQKTKTEQKENTMTALFVKYDKEGNEEFSKTMQILGDSRFKSVKEVSDGYIVVGQSIYEKSTLGNATNGGAIIMKYDKSGNVIWQHNYGGNKSGLYNDLYVTEDAIYAVGKNYGRLGIINKYTLDGEYIKTGSYEFTDTLGFTSIDKVGDQFVVVGAKKVKEDEYDPEIDALVVKYDEECEYVSEVTYDNKGLERFNVVTHDDKNNLIMIGHSAVLDKKKSTKQKNIYNYHGVIAKYRENLKQVFLETYGLEKDTNSYLTDLLLINNHYLVSGYSKYKKEGYFSKLITYTTSGKMVEVK